jgi:hypothetical protein
MVVTGSKTKLIFMHSVAEPIELEVLGQLIDQLMLTAKWEEDKK